MALMTSKSKNILQLRTTRIKSVNFLKINRNRLSETLSYGCALVYTWKIPTIFILTNSSISFSVRRAIQIKFALLLPTKSYLNTK